MNKTNSKTKGSNRRDFLFKAFSSCALCCVAPKLLATNATSESLLSDPIHKFDKDADLSIQDAFNIAFRETYIPIMRSFQNIMGHEKFIEMLKEASESMYDRTEENIDYSERTLEVWARNAKHGLESWRNRLTYRPSALKRKQAKACAYSEYYNLSNTSHSGFVIDIFTASYLVVSLKPICLAAFRSQL